MNVLIISTFDRRGGAAESAFRHLEALRDAGIEARMLVRTASTEKPWIKQPGRGKIYNLYCRLLEWSERFRFVWRARHRSDWFAYSMGDLGLRIHDHTWVMEADILHVHWVQKGFLSIRELRHLGLTGKPLVWHLHDMWAFTGGCHYTAGCTHFIHACGECPMLWWRGSHDLSAQVLAAKASALKDVRVHVTTSSRWLADEARRSSLFRTTEVSHLPMGVHCGRFLPGNPLEARSLFGITLDHKVFLFVAMNASDPRKGLGKLIDAMHRLKTSLDSSTSESVTLAVLGRFEEADRAAMPFHTVVLGYRQSTSDILAAYRSADFFILPSLEDNLPNTVLEAMACGTPVIAYDCGGVPEMVDHGENGFLVPTGDTDALAEALKMAVEMTPEDHARWRLRARERTVERYSYPVIADKHLAHYRQLLSSSE